MSKPKNDRILNTLSLVCSASSNLLVFNAKTPAGTLYFLSTSTIFVVKKLIGFKVKHQKLVSCIGDEHEMGLIKHWTQMKPRSGTCRMKHLDRVKGNDNQVHILHQSTFH